MEQRSESRLKFNDPVLLSVLQNDNTASRGRFVDLSSNGMRIRSDANLEIGSLLRLDAGNDLMMAEVRRCEPDEREYCVDLSILSWLEKSELQRLLREAVAGPVSQSTPDDPALMAVA